MSVPRIGTRVRRSDVGIYKAIQLSLNAAEIAPTDSVGSVKRLTLETREPALFILKKINMLHCLQSA